MTCFSCLNPRTKDTRVHIDSHHYNSPCTTTDSSVHGSDTTGTESISGVLANGKVNSPKPGGGAKSFTFKDYGLQGNREFIVEVLIPLVYEYMPMNSLEDHLFGWNTQMKIAVGAARGIEYLHCTANPPVIYRDLKSANILLDKEFSPKLSDFGLAKLGPVLTSIIAMCLNEEAHYRPFIGDIVVALEYLASHSQSLEAHNVSSTSPEVTRTTRRHDS
ncbi:hypothetical protein N665_0046s0041 [Sinapis alba]|nr:hypothetical protein N665_0046s0041 [Sinapis alba]